MPNIFIIDFKGQKNMLAQEVPAAVGMRALYIPTLAGTYDFGGMRFDDMTRRGEIREASHLKGNRNAGASPALSP